MIDKERLTEIIEALKKAGLVYNDADFCRKTGLKASFGSESKKGGILAGVALVRFLCMLLHNQQHGQVFDEVRLADASVGGTLPDGGYRCRLQAEGHRLALLVSLGGSSVGVVGVSWLAAL